PRSWRVLFGGVSGSVGPLPSLKGNLRRPHHRCWRRAFRKGSYAVSLYSLSFTLRNR
ncbi:unnamed protein product, partial [Musa hybrid cultivar]